MIPLTERNEWLTETSWPHVSYSNRYIRSQQARLLEKGYAGKSHLVQFFYPPNLVRQCRGCFKEDVIWKKEIQCSAPFTTRFDDLEEITFTSNPVHVVAGHERLRRIFHFSSRPKFLLIVMMDLFEVHWNGLTSHRIPKSRRGAGPNVTCYGSSSLSQLSPFLPGVAVA